MIHLDLMFVVIEVLIVLDLEPPGPLPGVLLTGFAEHTAHGVWPIPGSHVVPQALLVHNGSQCVSVQVRVSTELRSQCSVPARPRLRC